MSHFQKIILIHVVLIYSGICLLLNQNPDVFAESDNVFELTEIGHYYFTLKWKTEFFNGNGSFTVNITVDGTSSTYCQVQEKHCNDGVCQFNTTLYNNDCGFPNIAKACGETTVTVTRGDTLDISFNLAPNIRPAIVPSLTHSDNIATISWYGPTNTSDTECATRARALLQIGNDWPINSTAKNVALDAQNTINLPLEDCQHGDLTATVIYLTLDDDYDTATKLITNDNPYYPGVGITSVTINSTESCSLEASWIVACSNPNIYNVTWNNGGEKGNITHQKKYTIPGLKASEYTVSVQALWSDNSEMGDKKDGDPTSVSTVAPDSPKLNGVYGHDTFPKNLSVDWKPITPTCANVTSFTITYGVKDGSNDTTVNADADDLSYELIDLEPCTSYTVSIAAEGTEGSVQGDTITNKTGSEAPGQPTVTVGDVDTATIDLSWTEPAADSCPITKHIVIWTSDDGEGDGIDTVGPDSANYTIEGVTCNKDYKLTVSPQAEDGKNSISDSRRTKTADQAPGQTTVNVSPVMDNSTQLTANWSTPEYNCTGSELGDYNVTWTAEGEDQLSGDIEVAETLYIIEDLVPCTTYTVSIEARSNSGLLGEKGTNNATTAVEVQNMTDISMEIYTPYSLEVDWSEPEDNPCTITNYTVEWVSDETKLEDNVTELFYNITDLAACTDYTITVTAYTEKGPGEPSIETMTTGTDDIYSFVDKITITPESRHANVTWERPDTKCQLEYEVKHIGITLWTNNQAIDAGGTQTIADPNDTAALDNLVPYSNYTVCVTVKNGKTTYNTFITEEEVPSAPRNVAVKDGSITDVSLTLTWQYPAEENGILTNYLVSWSLDDRSSTDALVDPSDTSYDISGLAACTNYSINVIAKTEKGPGPPSDIVKLTSGPDAPPVDQVNITPESRHAQVTWERPETQCKLKYEVQHTGITTLWTNNQTIDSTGTQTIADPDVTAALDDLVPYSNYNVCVTVINGNTTCITFITEEEVPSAPRDVNVSLVTDVSLTLTWQYPEQENGILENYVVSWSLGSGNPTNTTVEANVTSYTIYGLSEGKYNFTVSVNNSEGYSAPSEPIQHWMNGPNPCDGGCIAGIVVGLLLVALVVPAIIFRDRIKNKFNTKSPLIEESPYELRGAAILKTDFKSHVEDMELDGATSAYQMLNDESPQKNKFAASKPFNRGKNRYANIHPFDDTRVKLQLMGNGPKGSDYINANHVTFPDTSPLQFIASQGPVDNTIADFWRMIWEHSVYDIVMLCNLVEKGKSKCAQYWTDSGEKAIEFGEFKIYCHTEEEDMSNQCITRYIDIVKNDQRRIVKQHHYVSWPDFGVPDNEDDMLKFLASVKGNSNSHAKNIVVHCSAGVGRTGTFIGLWVLTSILDENKYAKSIDVHKIALMMRECRSDMVQTKAQYLYLHKCLLKYMENMENLAPVSNEDQEDPIYGNVGIANMGYQ